jgi:methylenetetrahydrofolate reductase (NADPH)
MRFEKIWINRDKPTVSFELFPQEGKKKDKLYAKLEKFSKLKPDFISVTFGAGGSTRIGSLELIKNLKEVYSGRILAYLAGYGLSKREIVDVMDSYAGDRVDSILAVRGDKPEDLDDSQIASDSFEHADQLVQFISGRYDFPLGVAGYPEGHKECVSIDQDVDYLKSKIDSGASYIISQYFYENLYFYKFRDRCRSVGIKVPIIAGVMPVYNVKAMEKLSRLCGATVTHRIKHGLKQIDKNDKNEINEFGIGFAVEQCRDLIGNGVDGIHFYTMNRTKSIVSILKCLRAADLI